MKRIFFVVTSCTLLVARAALADETGNPHDSGPSWLTASSVRISGSMIADYGGYGRTVQSPQSETGADLGGELRVHPYSASGAMFAFSTGGALFGPTLTVVDAGYSLRAFAPRILKGVTGAIYFDVGPSLGFVTPTNELHHDIGGRAGVAFDLEIWNATLGLQLVYHGGMPVDGGVPAQWESSYSVGLRVGFAFDVGRKQPAATTTATGAAAPAGPSALLPQTLL